MVFLIYNIVISFLIFIFFINYFINFIYFKDISSFKLLKEIRDNDPLISVLIPARNEEDNIRKCLMSLVVQDYKNIEILVLDDNSTDDTSKVIKRISKTYKPLATLVQRIIWPTTVILGSNSAHTLIDWPLLINFTLPA
jgi:cellulose synthase/poly-beta-1,6-N-acetylglucosamine synthase-like glycosyltransferase